MFAKTSLIRSFVVLAGVAVAWGGAPERAAAQTPGVYSASQLRSFQQIVGNFGASNQQRARGIAIAISNNRQVVAIAIPNTWYGTLQGRLTPVQGRRNLYQFRVSRSLSTWVGMNVVAIDGIIEVDTNGRPVALLIEQRAGNNVAAVVNGGRFSSGVTSVWQALVSLRRVR